MDKSEFIKQALKTVREKHSRNLNATDMEKALQSFSSVAAAELLAGGEVSLPDLGKLKVRTTNARTGRNPRTGGSNRYSRRPEGRFHARQELQGGLSWIKIP